MFTARLEVFKRLYCEEVGLKINVQYLGNLQFADIVLFSSNVSELRRMIEELNRESLKVELKVNMQQTKIMLGGLVQERVFMIDSRTLESVKDCLSRLNISRGAYSCNGNLPNKDGLVHVRQVLSTPDR